MNYAPMLVLNITKKTLKMTSFLVLDFGMLVMDTVLSHKETPEKGGA